MVIAPDTQRPQAAIGVAQLQAGRRRQHRTHRGQRHAETFANRERLTYARCRHGAEQLVILPTAKRQFQPLRLPGEMRPEDGGEGERRAQHFGGAQCLTIGLRSRRVANRITLSNARR